MKQVWLILGIICSGNTVHAQLCPDNAEIKTDFNNGVNTQFDLIHPGLTNPFINKYNWAGYIPHLPLDGLKLNPNAGWNPQLTGITGGVWKMVSPFSGRMGSEYDYLYQINGKDPSLAELPYLDWAWERGWELMWMQTGYFPNMREINQPDQNSFFPGTTGLANNKLPYIILYNRYTGKMRIFANLITEFGRVDQIVTYLEYDRKKDRDVSGIFRNVANYDRPLDMPTANYGVTVYNKNSNNDNSWYSNDIQLGFDPCVCEYQTSMDFTLKTMKELKLNLYGRYLEVTVPVSQVEEDFLTQSSIKQDAQTGNSLIYKKTAQMYEDYQKQLEDYNTKLKDYNSFENGLKRDLLGWGRDLVTSAVGSAIPVPTLRDFILKNTITLKGKAFPDPTTAEGWAKAAREASKTIMGKGFDYYTQGYVADKPTAPVMPTATLGELRLTGDIFDENKVQITRLFTPGAFIPNNQFDLYEYPIYNKPTGLFALLERPKLAIYKGASSKEIMSDNRDVLFVRDNKFYVRFNEKLSYKLNDATKVDKLKSKILVAFIVEYHHPYGINKHLPVLNHFYAGTRVSGGNMKVMHHYDKTRVYETEWVDIKELNQQVFGITIKDTAWFSNAHAFPISLLNERFNGFQEPDSYIKNIKMKILADLYFTDNEEMNTTQVFTYLVYDKYAPEQETSVLTHLESPEEMNRYTLGEVKIAEQYITPGHALLSGMSGKDLFIDAEKISVTGNITVAPGFNLYLRALTDIVVDPEAVLAPEVILEIKRDYYNLPMFGELTNDELNGYCRGQNKRYNANTSLGKAPLKFEDIVDEIKDKPETQTRMVFYPNPANSELYIHLSDEADYTYQLFDITSRPILQGQIQAGEAGIVNISQAQEGIYILRVEGKGQVFTQKVIIKH